MKLGAARLIVGWRWLASVVPPCVCLVVMLACERALPGNAWAAAAAAVRFKSAVVAGACMLAGV